MKTATNLLCVMGLALAVYTHSPTARGESDLKCIPIRLIKAGTEFSESMKLGGSLPTEVCIETVGPQGEFRHLLVTLRDKERTLVSLICPEPKSQENESGFEFLAYVHEVIVHTGMKPRNYLPYNFYLFVELKINGDQRRPKSGRELIEKIQRQMEFSGFDIGGELRVGDEVFAVLRNDGWGKRDFKPKSPPGPLTRLSGL